MKPRTILLAILSSGGRLRRGITPEINAVSTLIFAVSVALIVIWYHVRARSLGAQAQELLEHL